MKLSHPAQRHSHAQVHLNLSMPIKPIDYNESTNPVTRPRMYLPNIAPFRTICLIFSSCCRTGLGYDRMTSMHMSLQVIPLYPNCSACENSRLIISLQIQGPCELIPWVWRRFVLIFKADQADAQSFVTRESKATRPHSAVSHTLVYKPHPFLLPFPHSLLYVLTTLCDSALAP